MHNVGGVSGERATRYRFVERLGQGGMGEVFLAEDLRLQRHVALKLLRPELCDDQACSRLLQEARAASALNHPNIAVVYEIDELDRGQGPERFIAMEYVPGRTLAQLAGAAPLEIERVLDLAAQVAGALAEAHAHGLVHRDVKPSNVMVTSSGRVKVLDFGLATRGPAFDDQAETRTRGAGMASPGGALAGTLAYMSPEQARGQHVDARSDVFSLGALVYELLAGRPAFPGQNAVQVLEAVLTRDPPPLEAREGDPRRAQLEALARRMLAKDREARPAGMAEVLEGLAAVRAGRGPQAAAASVAVLCFDNITGHGEDAWLGAGIAETVTADLKALPGLAVLGRERVNAALRKLGLEETGGGQDVPGLVGRELGASFVLSGGFQRAGQAVRVTARLTDVAAGSVARTVKIDGTLPQIFELQDRVARELASALRPGPGAAVQAPDETQVLAAYEAFAKGVLNVRVESYEALDRAVYFFERATALDPGYARAHLELGSAWASKAQYLGIDELAARALTSYRRALELRPGLVRAWREMGSTLVSLGRVDEGLESIRRALELDGEDVGALGSMGRALFVGRARFREAAEWFERALARNPQAGWYALQLSHCLALLRDFERGEAAARRAVALQEELFSGQEGVVIVGAHMRQGHLAALQGRHGEALEHFEREQAFLQRVDHALRGRIQVELHLRLGSAHLGLGQAERAQAELARALDAYQQRLRLGADEPFTRYYAACAHARRGEAGAALDALEQSARQARAFTIERARVEPELESLAGEPRFGELLASAP